MMAPTHELVSAGAQIASSVLAASIWQGMLLAGAAAMGLRFLPTTPAPVRFAIWFAVLLLVVALPFATVLPGHGGAVGAMEPAHARVTIDERWCLWIAGLWAAASTVQGVMLGIAAWRVAGLWRRARPVENATGVGCNRRQQLCVSDEVDRPTVIGFFPPRILIPEWLLRKLTGAELEQIILHECGHITRRDDWLNLLQKLAVVVFPLNPALLWVERRLCFEREVACDEGVLRTTGAPKAYAECLAKVAEYRMERRGLVRGLELALGALGREPQLARRVHRVLSGDGRMKSTHGRLVLAGALLMLGFCGAGLQRSPQLVGFSHAGIPEDLSTQAAAFRAGGLNAIAVRAEAAPGEEWRTTGDAPPQLSRPVARQETARRGESSTKRAAVQDSTAQMAYGEWSGESVATTRQVSPTGDVVIRVVRIGWVQGAASTNPEPRNTEVAGSNGDVSDARDFHPVAIRYEAVPVEGGWVVFQL